MSSDLIKNTRGRTIILSKFKEQALRDIKIEEEFLTHYEKGEITDDMVTQIKKLQKALDIAMEAIDRVNNVAPPMYKYNYIEAEMVMSCREAKQKIKGVLDG